MYQIAKAFNALDTLVITIDILQLWRVFLANLQFLSHFSLIHDRSIMRLWLKIIINVTGKLCRGEYLHGVTVTTEKT